MVVFLMKIELAFHVRFWLKKVVIFGFLTIFRENFERESPKVQVSVFCSFG